MFAIARRRWSAQNGYREVLVVGLPLVASLGAATVMQFTDRIFLSRYSMDSIAAVVPAWTAWFTLLAFFFGICVYTNVFVAQYTGARQPGRVGAALWQGVYVALGAGLVMGACAFVAEPLFHMVGHPPNVAAQEATYFRILCLGAVFVLLMETFSCFYSGRGITRPVMVANMAGAALNIPLDYALIFGWGPFPELGIAGAAIASVCAAAFTAGLFGWWIFTRHNEKQYAVRSAWRPDRILLARLVRFGLPGGVEFFLEISAITFFIFIVGRIGTVELAASNIVFAVNTLGFLPMVGLHIAVSSLVGQAVGRGEPEDGAQATGSALHMALLWSLAMIAIYIFAPRVIMDWFRPIGTSDAEWAAIVSMGVVLLRFVALYCLFDTVAVIYFGALKGAGDILFVMRAIGTIAVFGLAIPAWLVLEVLHAGLIAAWIVVSVYVVLLGAAGWLRFRQGGWRSMRVIESAPVEEPSSGTPSG
ncbi:MATE family efflux transporter [Oceanidesulfovibrio indonesiensis]|uniref:MATE family efflux transporter n=1 Tax=Oceanidesulfovibrio indonesiensis TaxID=54767 RepID=UPI001F3B75B6|nr:MATE family efflux transporter [Oceanidesulfovibrio indonesiensis]